MGLSHLLVTTLMFGIVLVGAYSLQTMFYTTTSLPIPADYSTQFSGVTKITNLTTEIQIPIQEAAGSSGVSTLYYDAKAAVTIAKSLMSIPDILFTLLGNILSVITFGVLPAEIILLLQAIITLLVVMEIVYYIFKVKS